MGLARALTPPRVAQGTVSSDKNELLFSTFGINYNDLPQRFRKVREPAPALRAALQAIARNACPRPLLPCTTTLHLPGLGGCVAAGHSEQRARGRQHGAARAACANGAARGHNWRRLLARPPRAAAALRQRAGWWWWRCCCSCCCCCSSGWACVCCKELCAAGGTPQPLTLLPLKLPRWGLAPPPASTGGPCQTRGRS